MAHVTYASLQKRLKEIAVKDRTRSASPEWFVACIEAAEMYETNKLRDWAELLLRGSKPISRAYVSDWLADRYEDLYGYQTEEEVNAGLAELFREYTGENLFPTNR